MKVYKIKYKAVFEGVIEVRAENRMRAKEIVQQGFGASINTPSKTGWDIDRRDKENEGIIDWDFSTTPEKTTIS